MAAKQVTGADMLIKYKQEIDVLRTTIEDLEDELTEKKKKDSDLSKLVINYKKQLDETIKQKEQEKVEIQKELDQLKKKNILLGDNVDRTREVLKLSAFGYATSYIYNTLVREKNIDITVKDIERIVTNIEIMPPDLYEFYMVCKREFAEKVSIDNSFFTSTIYKKFMLLETIYDQELARARELEDQANILKFGAELTKIYSEMGKMFAKNGVEAKKQDDVKELASDVINGTKSMQSKSNFGKLTIAKSKAQ